MSAQPYILFCFMTFCDKINAKLYTLKCDDKIKKLDFKSFSASTIYKSLIKKQRIKHPVKIKKKQENNNRQAFLFDNVEFTSNRGKKNDQQTMILI